MTLRQLIGAAALVTVLAGQALASDYPRHDPGVPSWIDRIRPAISFHSTSCLPIAAVSQTGSPNGGLNASGSLAGGCRSADLTQAYVRTQCRFTQGSEYCGVLFTYYFEKDQGYLSGHRHDWEHVIVWTKNGEPEFMTISDHRGFREFDLRYSYSGDDWNDNIRNIGGVRFYVRYWRTTGSWGTNSMDVRTTSDSAYADEYVKYTLWDDLTPAQKGGIGTDWGSANQRLSDATFDSFMQARQPSDMPSIY